MPLPNYCAWCGHHTDLPYETGGKPVLCQSCIDGWITVKNRRAASREIVLDLCCGQGGAARGYAQAGHYVVGIDSDPDCRKGYLRSGAAEFICGDALTYLADEKFTDRFSFVHFSPPCFPAGTPVVTDRGVVPIETVVPGDQVLTHQNRWRPVTTTMTRKADVYSDGWLAATADHPFWAREQVRARNSGRQGAGGGTWQPRPAYPCEICGQPTASKYGVCQKTAGCRQELGIRSRRWSLGEPSWIPAGQLDGLFLAIPESAESLPIPDPGCTTGPAFWWTIGRWAGDGWLRISQSPRSDRNVIICCADSEADDLKHRLSDTGLAWIRSQQRTTTRFTLSSRALTEWLAANFGRGASSKTIPGWLLGANQEIRQAFLEGYVSADGSSGSGRGGVTSTSAGLAFGARLLATSLGYTTSIYLNTPPPEQVIEGRTVRQRPWWRTDFRPDDGRYTRHDGQHRWVKRRGALAFRGRETVYDLTVEDDHSFIAWGFVVHNCQHFSQMSRCRPGIAAGYPDLITPGRPLLNRLYLPYVIENVGAARPWLRDPVTLCMWMFGRETYRHRLIEAGGGFSLQPPPAPEPGSMDAFLPRRINRECGWPHPVPTARAGHWKPGYFVSVAGHERKEPVRRVMEIDWMSNREAVAEAIPPYLSGWVGQQLASWRTALAA